MVTARYASTLAAKGVNVDLKGRAQATLSAAKAGITGQASTELNGGASLALQAALVKIN